MSDTHPSLGARRPFGLLMIGAVAGFCAGLAGAAILIGETGSDIDAVRALADENAARLASLSEPSTNAEPPSPVTEHQPAGFPKMVAAFDAADCPPPWLAFSSAAGRVLLGAGLIPGTRERAVLDSPIGGSGATRLSTSQLPAHVHPFTSDIQILSMYEQGTATTLHQFLAYVAEGRGEPLHPETFVSGIAGADPPERVRTVPPYRAVTFCMYPENAAE